MIFVIALCIVLATNGERVIGSFASCIHGGTKYKDGEYFPPNNTVIKAEGPQQCVQCRCHQGLVVCEIENCSSLDCQMPIQHPRFCCPRCPGTLQLYDDPSELVFSQGRINDVQKKKKKTDCVSSGKHFSNGSVWQPVIGPFGTMACVQCRCEEGRVVCSRIRCEDLPCSYPRRKFGECCPVCPISEIEKKGEASCLPKTSELFVFRTPNVQNTSEKIEYAFLENKPKNEMAAIHTWTSSPKNSARVFAVKLATRQQFQRLQLKALGSVSRRRFEKYAKRAKKLGTNCFVNCLRKIERLENSLKIYAAKLRSKCNEDEVDIVDI